LADALRGADVGLYEQYHALTFRQRGARGSRHSRAGGRQAPHDRVTHALASARHEGALAGDLRRIAREARYASDPRSHGTISSRVIFSPTTTKTCRSSTGLPGKLPETRHVTTAPLSVPADETTSSVCRYLAAAASIQLRTAATPRISRPSSRTIASSAKQAAQASAS